MNYFRSMTLKEAHQQLKQTLKNIYEEHEVVVIIALVLEKITGLSRVDRLLNPDALLSKSQEDLFSIYSEELSKHRPVQYVIKEAWFFSMKFYVDEQVLIPRPETEELVQWILSEVQTKATILDIGTGSGCIAVALKKKWPQWRIIACEISEKALAIARRNAVSNGTDLEFLQLDFLDRSKWKNLPEMQLIVSNPPYIPIKERDNMQLNVVDYEPSIALFVPDEDPLLYYRAMGEFAMIKLKKGGKLFVEVHESLAFSVKKLFSFLGFDQTEIRMDIQGKPRMIKATRLL
jgi:release factor glutamine methyltransferase